MMLTKVCISLQVARVTTRRAVSTVQTSDLTKLAKKLDIKSHEDWYAKLKRCQLSEIAPNLSSFVPLSQILNEAYPAHTWYEWLFHEPVPRGFWTDSRTQLSFMEWAGSTMNIAQLDGWYAVDRVNFRKEFGSGLLSHFNDSLIDLLKSTYPNHTWHEWLFPRTPKQFWGDQANQRKFLDWAATKLGLTRLTQWYMVDIKDVQNLGGWALLDRYGDSLAKALTHAYPDHAWQEWLFKAVPQDFWSSHENRKRYVEWIGPKLGVSSLDDWYLVTSKEVLAQKGSWAIMRLYSHSLYNLLRSVYPDHDWAEWKFTVPAGHWNDPENRRRFVHWAATQLSFTKLDDWYTIESPKVIKSLGGSTPLKMFSGSLVLLLKDAYPEHTWNEWRFSFPQRKLWSEQSGSIKRYLEWAAPQLGVVAMDQWYLVEKRQLASLKGKRYVVDNYGSMHDILKLAYPDHPWEAWRFSRSSSRSVEIIPAGGPHKDIMNQASVEFGITMLSDWYGVSRRAFEARFGSVILRSLPSPSMADLLKLSYPTHEWVDWRFKVIKRKFWESRDQRLAFLSWCAVKLHITYPVGWYNVGRETLVQLGGRRLLDLYGSMCAIMKDLYPDHIWHDWLFKEGAPRVFWQQAKNQQQYLLWLQKQLNINDPSDWYRVSSVDFSQNHGQQLMAIWSGSVFRVLEANLSEHQWDEWSFFHLPDDYFADTPTKARFIHALGQHIGVSQLEQWKYVELDSISLRFKSGLLNSFDQQTLERWLREVYPYHTWE